MEEIKKVFEEENKAVIPPADADNSVIEPVEAAAAPELNSDPVPDVEEVADAEVVPDVKSGDDVGPVEPVQGPLSELAEGEMAGTQETKSMPIFTQEDMNEKIGTTRVETREKTFKFIYDRYGVENEEQMDELFNNAQRFESLKESYDAEKADWSARDAARDAELAEIKEQVALMQSGIDSNRYDDAKLILKGKGLEVNLENIENELATHPEWKKVEPQVGPAPFVKKENPEPVSKISVLGNSKDVKPANPELDERAQARKLFDL